MEQVENKKQLESLPSESSNSLCRMRWVYPIVNFGQQAIRNCCRTSILRVSNEEVKELGTDVFMNHPFLVERRNEMFRGERHKDCESCWNLEDSGMESPRQGFENIEDLNFFSSPCDGDPIQQNRSYRPDKIDLELSNLCDAKCMYCCNVFSSKWAQEDIEQGRMTQADIDRMNPGANPEFEEAFWQWFEEIKPGLGHINIIGGEPFLNKNYVPMVERILESFQEVERPREGINFVTVTNLNAPSSVMDRVVKVLPKLNERFTVNIDASMEATGGRGEYIRDGIIWERWFTNLERILELKLDRLEVGIQAAINILCLSDLPEFFKVINELRHKHNSRIALKTNIVSYPYHHSPYIATPDLVLPIKKAANYVLDNHETKWDTEARGHKGFNWDRYGKFLMQLADSILNRPEAEKRKPRAAFYNWVREYDRVRERDLLSVFPDYQQFFKICKQEYEANREPPLEV